MLGASTDMPPVVGGAKPLVVVSYNVENLFDPRVSAENPDSSFTPGGDHHFTFRRLRAKARGIARALACCAGGERPALVGLCEVENAYVVRELTTTPPLHAVGYRYLHRDSPDHRGIDVALLYDPTRLTLRGYNWLVPTHDSAHGWQSREMLCAQFELPNGELLSVVQCHWPSKASGPIASGQRRAKTARRLMRAVDSMRLVQPDAKIIAMGDFNEEAAASLFERVSTPSLREASTDGRLVNLLHPDCLGKRGRGSHKYHGQWSQIDLFLVSSPLLEAEGYQVEPASVGVVALPWLLERDEKFGGLIPYRTYKGIHYNGGYSDHLPIVLRLSVSH